MAKQQTTKKTHRSRWKNQITRQTTVTDNSKLTGAQKIKLAQINKATAKAKEKTERSRNNARANMIRSIGTATSKNVGSAGVSAAGIAAANNMNALNNTINGGTTDMKSQTTTSEGPTGTDTSSDRDMWG